MLTGLAKSFDSHTKMLSLISVSLTTHELGFVLPPARLLLKVRYGGRPILLKLDLNANMTDLYR